MVDPDDPHVGTPPRIPGYEDGYPNCNGAGETPSDSLDLDPMLYPHRKEPFLEVQWDFKEPIEQYQARVEAAEAAQERKEYREGRSFTLSADVAMGANLAPSRK